MKLALKLVLAVVVLLAGAYAATPLWLSYVVAGQLPTGWQLLELKSGYPRPAGIKVGLISVKGAFGTTGLTLTATDLNLVFRDFETDIDKVSADVFLQAGEPPSGAPLSLDDLPIPIEELGGQFPRLSVNRLDLAVHLPLDDLNVTAPPARRVMLDLEDLELTPSGGDGFHLSARLSFEDSLRLTGKLEVEAGPDMTRASIRFPSGEETPWLDVRFDQKTLASITTTRIEAVLNADAANRDWLDSVLARSTRRAVTQFGGKLSLNADFSGQGLQGIDRLALTSENLHLLSDTGMLKIDADLLANRQHDTIGVELASPVAIEYQGEAGWIEELTASTIPGLRLPARSKPAIKARFASVNGISMSTGDVLSAATTADIDIDIQSAAEHLTLKSTGLQIALADLNEPESATVEGVAVLDWNVDAPVAYSADGNDLAAEKIGISASVASRGGKLSSTGKGVLTRASSSDPVLNAETLELAWRDLDLEKLTGKLTTRTRGFSAIIEDQTWKGFELDMNYTLLEKNRIKGTGKVLFTNGSEVPLAFSGNTETARWDVKVATSTVKLAKLRSLLSIAHVKLPAEMKLTDGYIEMQGDIRLADDITADMKISGHDMIASMHESRVVDADFDFDLIYDKTLKVNGPLSVGVIELAGGIDVNHFKAELNLEGPDLFEVKNVFAEVFDGQLELGGARYSEQQLADTSVEFTHLNLDKLLTFADVDGLRGSGFLNVSLPVGSDKTGLHIKNGTFGSTGPGQLAYTKQGLAGSNIGLKALENFQYKELSGTFNYQSDGNYLMYVRLEGKNPDLYGGHPVVFNLNINGLLPAVFESMFVTGSFEESILREIKNR